MTYEGKVKVTNHGMISIPAVLRHKYQINDGDQLSVLEDEDGIRIIPILSIEELRKKSVSAKKMMEIIQKSHEEELELEK